MGIVENNDFMARKIGPLELDILYNIVLTSDNHQIQNYCDCNINTYFMVNLTNNIILPKEELILLYDIFQCEKLLFNNIDNKKLLKHLNIEFDIGTPEIEKYVVVTSRLASTIKPVYDSDSYQKKYLFGNGLFCIEYKDIAQLISKKQLLTNDNGLIVYYSFDGKDKNTNEYFKIDLTNFDSNEKYAKYQVLYPEIHNDKIVDYCLMEGGK